MLKITRKLFVDNKENMEDQIRALLTAPTADIRITKIVVDIENRVGLLRWQGHTIAGSRLVFITDNNIIVRNLSQWHDIDIETVALKDKLYHAMRHRDKAPGIAEYRFK